MTKVYLSLGSNIGDRVGYLNSAIALLKRDKDISNIKVSSFYETDPVGYEKQDDFVNCVLSLETGLSAQILLSFCQKIEKDLKRVRLFRWGPRTIDVDILLFGDIIINETDLIIPHERMFDRAFVMVPLSELDGEYKKYLNKLENQKVRKILV